GSARMPIDMPLREDFERSGLWLFRWRSYLPVLFLLLFVGPMLHFTYFGGSETTDRVWELFCLLIALSGLAVRVVAVGFTAPGTSGGNTRAQRADSLNTTGMYSVVRHPLYLGNFLMWMGVALLPHHAWLAAVVALVFCVYYERIMFGEEEFLRKKFGSPYEEWASRTPAFVPAFSRWTPPRYPFSLRLTLRREHPGFFALIILFTAIEVLGDRVVLNRWAVDPLWAWIFGVGTALYLVVVTLKKSGRLDVAGR
ncbi:MAG TPA: isoprenylcysteine carboxylmethyltransferase family protein, partial [Longimicrobiaceae bacterium]|nr:isoprenylcysteine carboxylmethyltransferase family protein [Longimicrobiaceae bacterium]